MGVKFFFLLGALVLAMVWGCLHLLVWCTQDRAEPPILENSIPFVTPIIGILKHRTDFMVQIRNSYPDVALYTLRLPGSRAYIVNSPGLIPSLQRQKRSIAFEPIPVQAAANIMGISQAGIEVIGRNCTDSSAYFGTFLKATHPVLAPGVGLDSISRASVKMLAASMDKVEADSAQPGAVEKLDLWHWIRHEVLYATTEAIYGPGNPFRNPENEHAYYNLEKGLMLQMLQIHPLLAQGRVSFRARESLVQAFHAYFATGSHRKPDTSTTCLVQTRYNHNLAHGLCSDDIARTEIGQLVASLSNTIPGAFWMIWHVLSDPQVLASCREEIDSLVMVDSIEQVDASGRIITTEVSTLDCSRLTDLDTCPITNSTWQEVLRFNHVGTSARVVMEDTFLGGYLLKKGSTAMVISSVMHSDVSVWGPSAGEFDHRRFLAEPRPGKMSDQVRSHIVGDDFRTTATKQHKIVNLGKIPANRTFGGGSTLCPGRNLATREILSLLAVVISRFDVLPASSTHWNVPKRGVPGPTSMPTPEPAEPGDLMVKIVPRFPNRKWRVV